MTMMIWLEDNREGVLFRVVLSGKKGGGLVGEV
jgi:hypothetical protein